MKQKELKEAIEKEIRELLKEVDARTLDQKKLKSGLKSLENYVTGIPWYKFEVDDD